MSTDRSYVTLPPHFRQALPDPLERTGRTAVLDQIAENWLTWPRGDSRWDTVAALVSILSRVDADDHAAAWGDAVSAVIRVVHDASQADSRLMLEDALATISELATAERDTAA